MKPAVLAGAAFVSVFASPLFAQELTEGAQDIDYAGFAILTHEVAEIRQGRLLSLSGFEEQAAKADTLILDARSRDAFELGHIDGSVNLPFSDFTEDKLRKVIGANKDRLILIYCNNNFSDNASPIPLKKAPLALNIPTFINLVGYGYTNVWELGETVTTADVAWVGTTPMAQFRTELSKLEQPSQQ